MSISFSRDSTTHAHRLELSHKYQHWRRLHLSALFFSIFIRKLVERPIGNRYGNARWNKQLEKFAEMFVYLSKKVRIIALISYLSARVESNGSVLVDCDTEQHENQLLVMGEKSRVYSHRRR